MAEAFPLDWPDGWPRTPSYKRADGRGRFANGQGSTRKPVSLSKAAQALFEEVERLGATSAVVSSNLQRRLDGGILASQRSITDPGVAIYFMRSGQTIVMARDAFDRVEDNIRSLALAIEAMRTLERHGGGQMMDRAFSGFTALPPPDKPIEMGGPAELPRPWHQVLGVDQGAAWSAVRSAYREKIRTATDQEKYALNAAYETAKRWRFNRMGRRDAGM
jgi:hypothetical protein